MAKLDAVIVGAGPAGAATAITLARAGRSVAVLEKRAKLRFNVAETLAPNAVGVATHFIGPLDQALGQNAFHTRGNISLWGNDTPDQHDFFYSPAGAGYCVNRQHFDAAFRSAAHDTGAQIITDAAVTRCEYSGDWTTHYNSKSGPQTITSTYLIDASGRAASVAKSLGVAKDQDDPLFSFAMRFVTTEPCPEDAHTRIEASPFGWWYSNALPVGENGTQERVIVLHTDKDLAQAKQAATPTGFLDLLKGTKLMAPHLAANGYTAMGKVQGAPAGNARLAPDNLSNFLAVGDAAQALDPLSSQGIHQALLSASFAGQMVNYALSNDAPSFLDRYTRDQDKRWAHYQKEYAHFYAMESRWPDHPFWNRRQHTHSNFEKETARDVL